jgi:hypothetical protein
VKSVEKKKSVADQFTVNFMTAVLFWSVTQKPNKKDYGVDTCCVGWSVGVVKSREECGKEEECC